MNLLEDLLWFVKSDVELKYTTCWYDENGLVEKIDGFRFYSKRPFSRSYQWCGSIGLENTYGIISVLQQARKERKKAVLFEIRVGSGVEILHIWRGSFKKAEEQIFEMIKKLQVQY